MRRIKISVTALSPLVFSLNSGDQNMVSTLKYVPGTYIRGVFANEYIKQILKDSKDAHQDDRFYRWFLKGDIIFTNAYVSDGSQPYYPSPFCIHKEKYEKKEESGKKKYYNLAAGFPDEDRKTKSLTSFCRIDGNNVIEKGVGTSINFHHSRDRERGVSKEGIIFNYESIDEGQIFIGYIIGSEKDINELRECVKKEEYFVGRSRNSQYGRVKIDFLGYEDFPIAYLKGENVLIVFTSDVIIYNDYGYSVSDVVQLQKLIGCDIEKSFIKQSSAESFVSVWRLKTPSEVSFAAGSSFLVAVNTESKKRLFELQKTGIGARTNEGFGRFEILDNYESELFGSTEDKAGRSINKPQNKIPDTLRKILISVIEETIMEKAGLEAFYLLPKITLKGMPKSLIARLEMALRKNKLKEVINDSVENIAKYHLEDCILDNKYSLFEFLGDDEKRKEYVDLNKILDKSLIMLANEIGYNIDNNEDLHKKADKEFTATLLLAIRRKIKQGEAQND